MYIYITSTSPFSGTSQLFVDLAEWYGGLNWSKSNFLPLFSFLSLGISTNITCYNFHINWIFCPFFPFCIIKTIRSMKAFTPLALLFFYIRFKMQEFVQLCSVLQSESFLFYLVDNLLLGSLIIKTIYE